MAEVNALARIREDLKELVGKPVRLRANRGRKRVLEVDGILEQTYPNVFVVRWCERQTERRTSYNYADLLTKEVELSASEEEEGDSRSASATG
ncbi:MAG: Veg family protein [Firmicutes bacterium]|nr:Veg family protein [Bacillota bacterium]